MSIENQYVNGCCVSDWKTGVILFSILVFQEIRQSCIFRRENAGECLEMGKRREISGLLSKSTLTMFLTLRVS
jgi:hypothetical protein